MAGLPAGEDLNKQFEKLYLVFIQQLQVVLPPGTNIPVAYDSGTEEEQNFVQNLALFLTAFFKVPAPTVAWETASEPDKCIVGHWKPSEEMDWVPPASQCSSKGLPSPAESSAIILHERCAQYITSPPNNSTIR